MDTLRQIFQNFWGTILSMRITDIIDIIIVAFLIYKAISFIRRTNSVGVAKGIIILIAVLWISSILNLNVINFFLGKTVELGFLALIILFQPELRHILERVGSRKFSSMFGAHTAGGQMEHAISQVVIACSDMSATKTGALIVFERDMILDEPIKTGTVVDAAPAAELIKNVFYNKAPLHDGAMIMRDGRIAAAGCMLPLSNNANLSRDLGMRHRAGIGMSEQSDAVVVIVSEETGSISVAVDGMLKRHLAADTFEKLLHLELMPDEENKKNKNRASKLMAKLKVKNNGKKSNK